MKKLIFFMGLLALGLIISSCEQEIQIEYEDLEDTTTETAPEIINFSGQWEITAFRDSVAVSDAFQLLTASTSPNGNDSITIQDGEVKFWNFKVNAALNETDGTFNTESSTCQICDEGVEIKIANGKIIDSDSIYFEIQFEDDITPFGRTYRMKGRRIKG